jgi:peptide/nickel transport system permease protein
METQSPKGASARPEFTETVANIDLATLDADSDIWHSYKSSNR